MSASEARWADALARAEEIARKVLAPRAQETDQASGPPAQNIGALAEAGLMGLTTPERYGGLGAPGRILRAYTEILASACGVTCFVQGQHQSAALLIANCENDALKEELLPRMATGEAITGVAFAHLRRPGEPILYAVPDGEGYVLDGVAPWFTGYGVMTHVVIAGTLPEGRFVYGVVDVDGDAAMTASPPMRLCAMNASGTVSLRCDGLRLPAERVMKTITREQMAGSDSAAILAVTPQPFGVAGAAISLIGEMATRRGGGVFGEAAGALQLELDCMRALCEEWIGRTSDPAYEPTALRLRAQAIDLGVRAAHAAVAAVGGGANRLDHPAQRLMREAMFYTLTAQTAEVQAAELALTASRSGSSPGRDLQA